MLSRILRLQPTRFNFIKSQLIRFYSSQVPKAEPANYSDTSHIKPDDFKRMQDSLKKFSQCMSLGKYADA